jgi:hypothetical protein
LEGLLGRWGRGKDVVDNGRAWSPLASKYPDWPEIVDVVVEAALAPLKERLNRFSFLAQPKDALSIKSDRKGRCMGYRTIG